jgi:hypothetical protein
MSLVHPEFVRWQRGAVLTRVFIPRQIHSWVPNQTIYVRFIGLNGLHCVGVVFVVDGTQLSVSLCPRPGPNELLLSADFKIVVVVCSLLLLGYGSLLSAYARSMNYAWVHMSRRRFHLVMLRSAFKLELIGGN